MTPQAYPEKSSKKIFTKGKMDKNKLVIVGLVILLVGAFGYIGVGSYQDAKLVEQQGIFEQGAQYGYESAVYSLVEQAVTCEVVPVTIENQTINMVAVECLENFNNQLER